MLLMLEDTAFDHYRPRLKKWSSTCTAVFGVVVIMVIIIFLLIFTIHDMNKQVHILYVEESGPLTTTNEKFLSVALDTSIIASNFKHFDITNPKVIKLLKALSPAYLRIGGTMADRLIFTETSSVHFKHYLKGEVDGGECSYELQYCDYLQRPNFTMNGQEWLGLNKLAQNANLSVVFDLNALRRFDNGSWDYRNAEQLINYSDQHNLELNWELGNEPNAYRRQFDYDVSPEQLSKDFYTLHHILLKYPKYAKSLIVGPDVTRPEPSHNDSMIYLKQFLKEDVNFINAITWHQYYFNGATAKTIDFLDPSNFDILELQINVVQKVVKGTQLSNKPIWLGETSSAFGGGAPYLSNRYIASFLWLDKLGLAAKYGLDVVIRQSFFQGYYALVNINYHPAPDWWVSVLYKKLVGNKVVDCHMPHSGPLRLYCQCTKRADNYTNISAITVFGVNINNHRAKIRLEGIFSLDSAAVKNLTVDAYILNTVERIDSRFIYLNNVHLTLTETNDVPNFQPKKVLAYPYLEMPAFSLAFWVVPVDNLLPYC